MKSGLTQSHSVPGPLVLKYQRPALLQVLASVSSWALMKMIGTGELFWMKGLCCTEAEVLGDESERSSKAGVKAASMSRIFK